MLHDNVSVVYQTGIVCDLRQGLDVLCCIRVHGILDVPNEQFAVADCSAIRSARSDLGHKTKLTTSSFAPPGNSQQVHVLRCYPQTARDDDVGLSNVGP